MGVNTTPILIAVCLGLCISCGGENATSTFPEAVIANGVLDARFYLPDSEKGYYRGSRFDWSGVMPELEYKGHTYFGQWFEEYNPTLHDAIMGPVEAFAPIGYEEANVGDPFLVIGIGMVTRSDSNEYHFSTPFPVANPGTWKVEKETDQVTFTQQLVTRDYAYEYIKTIQLISGKPEMVISHQLKNTGTRRIETDVYNHNFFVMDQQPTGPDFTVTFPFELEGEEGGVPGIGKLQGNQLQYQRVVEEGESFILNPMWGYGGSASDYDIRIENKKTGAGVRITSDQPIAKLRTWSAAKTICPEPFIDISIAPGETVEWKLFYEFYEL